MPKAVITPCRGHTGHELSRPYLQSQLARTAHKAPEIRGGRMPRHDRRTSSGRGASADVGCTAYKGLVTNRSGHLTAQRSALGAALTTVRRPCRRLNYVRASDEPARARPRIHTARSSTVIGHRRAASTWRVDGGTNGRHQALSLRSAVAPVQSTAGSARGLHSWRPHPMSRATRDSSGARSPVDPDEVLCATRQPAAQAALDPTDDIAASERVGEFRTTALLAPCSQP